MIICLFVSLEMRLLGVWKKLAIAPQSPSEIWILLKKDGLPHIRYNFITLSNCTLLWGPGCFKCCHTICHRCHSRLDVFCNLFCVLCRCCQINLICCSGRIQLKCWQGSKKIRTVVKQVCIWKLYVINSYWCEATPFPRLKGCSSPNFHKWCNTSCRPDCVFHSCAYPCSSSPLL